MPHWLCYEGLGLGGEWWEQQQKCPRKPWNLVPSLSQSTCHLQLPPQSAARGVRHSFLNSFSSSTHQGSLWKMEPADGTKGKLIITEHDLSPTGFLSHSLGKEIEIGRMLSLEGRWDAQASTGLIDNEQPALDPTASWWPSGCSAETGQEINKIQNAMHKRRSDSGKGNEQESLWVCFSHQKTSVFMD